MNLLSHNINSFFYEYIHPPRNVLCLSLELVMTFLSTRHLHSHIDMLCLEGKYMSFFHSLPSLICLNKFLLSMITGWYMCESFSVCLYSWFGAHISRHASVFNTVLPGHDAQSQEDQYVHGCRGQYDCQLWVWQAVSGVVHCLSFLKWVSVWPWQVSRMLGSCASKIPKPYANEPSSLLPIGRECPILYGVGSMPMRHVTTY